MAATQGISHIHESSIRKIVEQLCCVIAVLGCVAASLNLLVYFSPTVRVSVYDLLTTSAKTRGIEMDLDMSQAIYFIGFGGFLAIFTAVAIYGVLRWMNSSMILIAIGVITMFELSIALQPVLIFVRPISVDPLPGLPPKTSTQWDHFTDAETTRQAKELLSQRGIHSSWEFGGMMLPILRAQDTPIARYVSSTWNTWEIQAVDQGDRITGKLHLLRNFRNFHAYFTLGPKAIRRYCSTPPVDLEADAATKPVIPVLTDAYFLHHVTPITELPIWPPRTRPLSINESLNEQIKFSQAVMVSNQLEFYYDSPEAFYLQLPILDDGGWYNALTGNEVSIAKGPEDLLTLQLPGGKHSIALRFFPPGLMLGGFICGGTLIAILLAVFVMRRGQTSPLRSLTFKGIRSF